MPSNPPPPEHLSPTPTAGASWTNTAQLLPSELTSSDVQALMTKCSLLREAEGGGSRAKQESRKALLLAASCAVSSAFLAVLQEQVEAEARGAAEQALQERRSSGGGGQQQAGAGHGVCGAGRMSGAVLPCIQDTT